MEVAQKSGCPWYPLGPTELSSQLIKRMYSPPIQLETNLFECVYEFFPLIEMSKQNIQRFFFNPFN